MKVPTSPEPTEANYWRLIDTWILDAVDSASLEEMCARLHGLYPADTDRRIKESSSSAHKMPARSGGLGYKSGARHLECAASLLPLPHPLDYEWRFAADSCARLAEMVGRDPPAKVALLGTPGLAEWLARQGLARNSMLFEAQKQACVALEPYTTLTTRCVDLRVLDDLPCAGTYDFAIADPPWYPPISESFVRAASHLLRLGGSLVLCTPGIGTRPLAAADRLRLIDFGHHVGLIVMSMSPGAVTYESPPFEVVALEAAGLADFPTKWRKGDVLTFVKAWQVTHDAGDTASESDIWTEVVVGRSRIRVRLEPTGDSILGSIVDRDVLDSVSSRDQRRHLVGVWTTTNHVYTTNSPLELIDALVALASGAPRPAQDANPVMVAAQKVVDAENATLLRLGIAA